MTLTRGSVNVESTLGRRSSQCRTKRVPYHIYFIYLKYLSERSNQNLFIMGVGENLNSRFDTFSINVSNMCAATLSRREKCVGISKITRWRTINGINCCCSSFVSSRHNRHIDPGLADKHDRIRGIGTERAHTLPGTWKPGRLDPGFPRFSWRGPTHSRALPRFPWNSQGGPSARAGDGRLEQQQSFDGVNYSTASLNWPPVQRALRRCRSHQYVLPKKRRWKNNISARTKQFGLNSLARKLRFFFSIVKNKRKYGVITSQKTVIQNCHKMSRNRNPTMFAFIVLFPLMWLWEQISSFLCSIFLWACMQISFTASRKKMD
jgi:hypothetical protein